MIHYQDSELLIYLQDSEERGCWTSSMNCICDADSDLPKVLYRWGICDADLLKVLDMWWICDADLAQGPASVRSCRYTKGLHLWGAFTLPARAVTLETARMPDPSGLCGSGHHNGCKRRFGSGAGRWLGPSSVPERRRRQGPQRRQAVWRLRLQMQLQPEGPCVLRRYWGRKGPPEQREQHWRERMQ